MPPAATQVTDHLQCVHGVSPAAALVRANRQGKGNKTWLQVGSRKYAFNLLNAHHLLVSVMVDFIDVHLIIISLALVTQQK